MAVLLQADFKVFVASLCFLAVTYGVGRTFAARLAPPADEKGARRQRAWILTLVSSAQLPAWHSPGLFLGRRSAP